jgi:hypothetical protein
MSSATARSADATAMSAPTESAPTSAHGEQATRRKKLRSIRANGPQCDLPSDTRTLPNRQRQPAAQRYLGESRRWLVVSARWPREHDIRTTTGREQPTAHTHIVIDLIVDGLGVRNAGAIIFDEVLRRRDAALVPLDQALITIPQLLPAPKDPDFRHQRKGRDKARSPTSMVSAASCGCNNHSGSGMGSLPRSSFPAPRSGEGGSRVSTVEGASA